MIAGQRAFGQQSSTTTRERAISSPEHRRVVRLRRNAEAILRDMSLPTKEGSALLVAEARALTAAPIFGQQRAPRWWLIRPSEAGTYCKIVIIWRSSSPNLGRVGRLDTAPQFCGLKHDHEQFSSGKCRCRRIARSRVGSCGGARREPRRRLRRMPEPNSGDRRGLGCRLKR